MGKTDTPQTSHNMIARQTKQISQNAATSRESSSNHLRHNDPLRRQRIIKACLEVIATKGVNGTTHRAVAAAANVPLGSTTYYFSSINDLIYRSFEYFMIQSADTFQNRMKRAKTQTQAIDAIIGTITDDLLSTQQSLAVNLELYAAAAHDARYRNITTQWMAKTQHALQLHFDARTAQLIDDVIEGATIRRAMSHPLPSIEETRAEARDALSRLLPPSETHQAKSTK